ncbi:MAG: gamma-glutamyl-gamma-aminobutyrate hydrolase family protein [Nocardioides sp.]
MPGGGDLAGHWSGQPEHAALYDVDDDQDAFDLAVARVALAAGVPLLAICRGLQVVNVLRGGTLLQDMDEMPGALGHHRHHVHQLSVQPGTLSSSVVGEQVEVSCYHHQCLAELGEGLVVTARSEEGVVEAVEIPDGPGWFLGLQWHPEDTWAEDPQQLGVFQSFVRAAAQR